MKRLFNVLTLWTLLLGASCAAQSTTVSATITDTDGFLWKNGTWSVVFVPNSSQPSIGAYTWNGAPLTGHTMFSGVLDSGGAFSTSIPTTSTILPVGSSWKFQMCPNAKMGCFSTNIPTLGTTMNLTAQLSALAQGPRFTNNDIVWGYGTVEVTLAAFPGVIFYNTTSNQCQQYTGTDWSGNCSGTGSVSGLVVLSNIAALKAYVGSAQQVLLVGYYSSTSTSPPDGGGGVFIDQGAGASADNGGTIIYNSSNGHNWKRQYTGTEIEGAWWGPKGDGVTDNSSIIQSVWNFMRSNTSPGSGGTLRWPGGNFIFNSQLTLSSAFQFLGNGKQTVSFYQNNGTTFTYTGSASCAVLANGNTAGEGQYAWSNMWIRHMEFNYGGPLSPGNYVNAICPIQGSQFSQGGIEDVQFTNWPGTDFHFNITLPSSTTAVTGYISDGTGGSAGRIFCDQTGISIFNAYLSGAGIPAYTHVIQQIATPQALFPATCSLGGTPYLIDQSLLIAPETIQVGYGSNAYYQNVNFSDISTSGDAQFIGSDPNSIYLMRLFNLLNWNHENGQNFAAGIPKSYINLDGIACYEIGSNTWNVFEGASDANPVIINAGNGGAACQGAINNLYVETGTVAHPIVHPFNIFNSGYVGPTISITNLNVSGFVVDSPVYFDDYTQYSNITLTNVSLFNEPPYTSGINTGLNFVKLINSVSGNAAHPNVWSSDLISTTQLSGQLASASNPWDGKPSLAYKSAPSNSHMNAHGVWFDGYHQGSVQVNLQSGVTYSNESMVDDPAEGRVFKITTSDTLGPRLAMVFSAIPADLIGQQVTAVIRWKLETSQMGYNVNGIGLETSTTYSQNNSTDGNGCTNALPGTWHTSFVTFAAVSTTTPFGFRIGWNCSAASTGAQTLKVAAVNVSTGAEAPYIIGGGALGPITWRATAAPTAGDYKLGDTVLNSVPTAGQPQGWICTTAGSPGTWTAMPNL